MYTHKNKTEIQLFWLSIYLFFFFFSFLLFFAYWCFFIFSKNRKISIVVIMVLIFHDNLELNKLLTGNSSILIVLFSSLVSWKWWVIIHCTLSVWTSTIQHYYVINWMTICLSFKAFWIFFQTFKKYGLPKHSCSKHLHFVCH